MFEYSTTTTDNTRDWHYRSLPVAIYKQFTVQDQEADTGRAEVSQRYKRRTWAKSYLRVKGHLIIFFLPSSLYVRLIRVEFQLHVQWQMLKVSNQPKEEELKPQNTVKNETGP